MKRKVLLSSLAIVLAICLATSSLVMALDDHLIADTIIGSKEEKIYSTATLEDDFADDKVLVVLTNKASLSSKNYSVNDFAEVRCTDVRNLTEVSTALAQAKVRGDDTVSLYRLESNLITFSNIHDIDTEKFNRILTVTLENPGKENVLAAIKALEVRQDIRYVGPSYITTLQSSGLNDTYYEEQWAINKIDLPEAWELTSGSPSVKIGILDSGIDGDHPDLANNIFHIWCKDFTSGTGVTVDPPSDPYGHGTGVASVIAALSNNSIGICGVGKYFNLVSIRVFDSNGNTETEHVIKGIEYATARGLPIINMSFSCTNSAALYDALENYQGLAVCAAGNQHFQNENLNNDAVPIYPASYNLSNIISVGASNQAETKCYFSHYGATSVDLFAPGEDILACYPNEKCVSGTHDTTNTTHFANGYHYTAGTSFAAPYVSGVAGLILSLHPNATVAQIKAWILNGVDTNSNYSGYCVSGGRLNAYSAVNNHLYTYYSNNALTHTRTCSCGISSTERHTWTTISTNSIEPNATIRTCTKCGYSTTVPS